MRSLLRTESFKKYNLLAKASRSQMRIQQMAFMIVAVFFFFILVAIAILGYEAKTLKSSANDLQTQAAIASLQTITNMPELTCGDLCLDEDKLQVLSSSMPEYQQFWGVSSIKVYKVYPAFTTSIQCPAPNCNYYNIYDSNKTTTQYSTFVSLCRTFEGEDTTPYTNCEIAKLLVGVDKIQ